MSQSPTKRKLTAEDITKAFGATFAEKLELTGDPVKDAEIRRQAFLRVRQRGAEERAAKKRAAKDSEAST